MQWMLRHGISQRESRGAGKLREFVTAAKQAKRHRPFYSQEGEKFDENRSHLTGTKQTNLLSAKWFCEEV